jgi:nucleotide-binding universal stress UspA family protein
VSRVIVVGVDGSAGAGAALAAAIELTSALGDELVVVHAAEPPFRSVGEEWRESERALEELGTGLVEAAREQAARAGVTVAATRVAMRPVEGLLHVAAERDARLIVVGTASTRPLTGLILGSVPHKLLHRSSMPVLVVPVPDGA